MVMALFSSIFSLLLVNLTLFFIILIQVLRDQGLGKYCDPEFVRAASREMQEAMDMTPEEFDAAAAQLLQQERQGSLRLPQGGPPGPGGQQGGPPGHGVGGGLPPDSRWGDEDDERTPLNPLPGVPSRFTASDRQASDAVVPNPPSRRRKGPNGGGGGRGGPDDHMMK